MTASEKRVAKVKTLYPDAFKRVMAVCVFASDSVDLEDHVARIVLAGKGRP